MLVQYYCLIILLFALVFYLFMLFNAKSHWHNASAREHSLVFAKRRISFFDTSILNKYLFHLGKMLADFLPTDFVSKQEFMYSFIQRDFVDFYINLSRCLLIFLVFSVLACLQTNLLFVLFALLVSCALFYEPELSYKSALKQVEASIKHITQCLEILLVRTETPIINALEIISLGLDEKFKYSRLELNKIINKAQKTGLEAALADYSSEIGLNIKEFISMLISISEGASKKAIQEQINKFLETENERDEEHQKSLTENLQLYLMFPVIFMLLVLMLPMADAITYALQNTGFVNGVNPISY